MPRGSSRSLAWRQSERHSPCELTLFDALFRDADGRLLALLDIQGDVHIVDSAVGPPAAQGRKRGGKDKRAAGALCGMQDAMAMQAWSKVMQP